MKTKAIMNLNGTVVRKGVTADKEQFIQFGGEIMTPKDFSELLKGMDVPDCL